MEKIHSDMALLKSFTSVLETASGLHEPKTKLTNNFFSQIEQLTEPNKSLSEFWKKHLKFFPEQCRDNWIDCCK